jgi:FkbM family methyltransferase
MQRHSRKLEGATARHEFLHAGQWFRVRCEVDSRIDESLKSENFYEHRMLGYITRVARGGAIVDIGANCGHHTVYFSLFTRSTKVYAFEPFPHHFELLLRNLEDNELVDKVVALPLGASSTVSQFEIRTNSAVHASRYTGLCVPVDLFVREPVAVMKVDVEGMELEALKGAQRILATSKPRLFVESHSEEHLAPIVDFLGRSGYAAPVQSFNASPTWEFVPQGAA